jgi:hypothetical protein
MLGAVISFSVMLCVLIDLILLCVVVVVILPSVALLSVILQNVAAPLEEQPLIVS